MILFGLPPIGQRLQKHFNRSWNFPIASLPAPHCARIGTHKLGQSRLGKAELNAVRLEARRGHLAPRLLQHKCSAPLSRLARGVEAHRESGAHAALIQNRGSEVAGGVCDDFRGVHFEFSGFPWAEPVADEHEIGPLALFVNRKMTGERNYFPALNHTKEMGR
jgi:hypothetical protein